MSHGNPLISNFRKKLNQEEDHDSEEMIAE